MKITDVKVRIINKEDSKLRAVASIVLEDCIALHDIKIIENDNGLFIAMPARKIENGSHRDIVHPINKETRDLLTTIILDEYKKVIDSEN